MSAHANCPDSKIASITCPAMDCRNVESWGCHTKATSKVSTGSHAFIYIPISSRWRGFNLVPPVLHAMPNLFWCRNPAWPVFGLWNCEKDQLGEDGTHWDYMNNSRCNLFGIQVTRNYDEPMWKQVGKHISLAVPRHQPVFHDIGQLGENRISSKHKITNAFASIVEALEERMKICIDTTLYRKQH